MFEDIGDIVKRRFVTAFRTVIHAFAEFLPFILIMFSIIFSLLTASFFVTQGYTTEKADIEAAYDYHVAVKGLNQSQMINIRDDVLTVFWNDFCYRTVTVDTHTSPISGSTSYDVYLRLLTGNKDYGFRDIFLKDTLESNLDSFLTRYNHILYPEVEERSNITVQTSPLYDLEAHETDTKVIRFFILLIFSVAATLLLTGIYSIRVNNQKFLYGIYSTFGADRKRLCATSTYEILVCCSFAFIPALLCSILFCNYTFAETSTGFDFSFSAMFLTIPFIFAIVLASTYFSTKPLSMQEPMSMIVSEDNSNLVSSPSRSVNMLKVRSSLKYEFLTLKRFRKRTCKLLAMSAIFCAMFVSGLYLADLYTLNAEIKSKTSADFTAEFENAIPEGVIKNIEMIEGVREAHTEYTSTPAVFLSSHILVDKDDTTLFSGLHTYTKNTDYIAENDLSYIPAGGGDVIELFNSLYTIEGDPFSVLTDSNTIVIGMSKNNRDVYDFAVGDTIRIGIVIPAEITAADPVENTEEVLTETSGEIAEEVPTETFEAIPEETSTQAPIEDLYLTGYDLLDRQIERGEYEYVTLTIGAVIYDYPSALYRTPLIMSTSLYNNLTNGVSGIETSESNILNVYLENDLDGKDIDRIEFTLRDTVEAYRNTTVKATGTYHDSLIEENKQYHSLITILAISILIAVPIIWFFSQILFYNRRRAEFDILLSIAATEKSICKLHVSGGLLLGIATILSTPLSVLCTYLISKFFTYILPAYIKVGAEIVISPKTELWTYLLCMALTLLCSILSSLIPFMLYRNKKRSAERKNSLSADE